MMIGPAPMISTLFMSVRFGTGWYGLLAMLSALFHQSDETIEQIANVVRTGTRLGMPLEAERWSIGAGETLQAAVEQRDVRDFHVLGQSHCVDGESVILAGDHHAPRFNILYRMIRAMMAKLHFHRACAAGEA